MAVHRRLAVVPLLVTLALCLPAPTASADQPSKLANTLAALWTKVLETPSASNPFGTGGPGFACWDLGGTVAALAPDPVPSCTVKTGTKIFVSGSSAECSTFPNDCPGANATEGQLETAAKKLVDSSAPPVTLDGKPVAVTFVKTGLLNIVLPTDNIFGIPAGSGHSVALGWVALLQPLPPGTHTIHITTTNPARNFNTQIVVSPGRQ